MITDEQAIEFAKGLQKYCEGKDCRDESCVLYRKGFSECILECFPFEWDISKLPSLGDNE